MDWRRDCRFFLGDRPCQPHKTSGVRCDSCSHFEPTPEQHAPEQQAPAEKVPPVPVPHQPDTLSILLIKLAATGDVLRTTSLLRGLREAHDPCTLTWLTTPVAAPLLGENPLIDQILTFDGSDPDELLTREFNLVINLDTAGDSCALATRARAANKIGFALGDDHKPAPLSGAAEKWFLMGLDDDLKKDNEQTYQALMCEILGLDQGDHRMILHLTEAEKTGAQNLARDRGVNNNGPVVGINTGAGERWPLKKWTTAGFLELTERLSKETKAQVLLLGGPREKERNEELAKVCGDTVIDMGTGHSLRDFAAIVDLCDSVVTGDTLAMQIAIALEKNVTVLFGPTSSNEIDLYGKGEKITSGEMDCLVCYLTSCDKDPNCMNTIESETVYRSVTRMLDQIGSTSPAREK